MPYETPEYHPAFEEYCETIFELAEDDLEVIQARIAERLDVVITPSFDYGPTGYALGGPEDGTIDPGSSYREPDTRHLSDVGVGESFTVSRIPEELEFTEGLLQFLEDASLVPGEQGSVTDSDGDGTTVEIGGGRVEIEPFAADRILVITR